MQCPGVLALGPVLPQWCLPAFPSRPSHPLLQFIVVSLKEGMFNNANVIFRTKFVDGVRPCSCVCGDACDGASALLLHELG